MPRKNYTQEQVLQAIYKADGVMEYVAKELGCTWITAKSYVDKWDETRDAFDTTECALHARAYRKFHEAIESGERWAIERILDTSARRNGHGLVEHKQVDHTSSDGSMKPHVIELKAPNILPAKDIKELGE